MKSKIIKFIIFLSLVIFLILLVAEPDICKSSALNGILLCGRVIIPSLFPFYAILLFLMESIGTGAEKLSFITKPILKLSGETALITLFSFLGGYPVGAKLLNDAVSRGKISENKARKMLNFCVNAGPAFILSAVGIGIIGSKALGIVLLISHIFASVIILFLHRFRLNDESVSKDIRKNPTLPATERFVSAVANAAQSTFGICSYVILFSVITAYAEYFAEALPFFNYLIYFLEVTTAVGKTGNIYLISAILGFSGLSVWCQIFSSAKKLKIKIGEFAFFRILHGLLSAVITALIIKASGIAVPTVSNGVNFSGEIFYSTPALAVSMLIMALIFLISLFSKKHTGKLLEDMV